jgi:preprotein translocase subunit SecE
MLMTDQLKFALAIALLIAGVAGFYVFADQIMAVRVLSVLVGLGAGVAVAWFTEPGRRFIGFANESVAEAKKVAWPSRKETLQTTAIVFGFVVVMALFLWLTDKSLEWVLYDLILGWKKS